MKKILLSFVFALFLVSFVSASVNFDTQPHSIYNLGDQINSTIKIVPNPDFNQVVSIDLKCGNEKVQVYKEFLLISQETKKQVIIPLVKPLIGNLSGECNLKVYAGDNLESTSETFKISKMVKIEFSNSGESYSPGQEVKITGSAIKENGEVFDGVYNAALDNGTAFNGQVTNGDFLISFVLPRDFSAGTHKLSVQVSEKSSSGDVLNSGNKITFLDVLQVPTSLEIVLENKSILPGGFLKGKIILHDQTGEGINGKEAYVAVKDSTGSIVKKITTKTNTSFEYGVDKSQPPANFQISAYSENVINSASFNVLENKEINSEIINRTLVLTNVGNVPYVGNLTVKIGNDKVGIPLSLGVGSTEKYAISAPDGNYNVVVGNTVKTVSLSGNAVQVEKISSGGISGFPIWAWAFILIILALGAYFAFKKNYRQRIFSRRKKGKVKELKHLKEGVSVGTSLETPVVQNKKKVELSLSIVGTKQNATVGCISIKNYPEISSGKGNVKETFKRIENLVEENKGFVYQSGSYIFFIFAPAITKTFKNQKVGILMGEKIIKILKEHNRKFKQRIEFGVSVNYGTIITKVEAESIKFMSLGTLITISKKLAGFSDEGIIISEKLNENMEEKVKGKLVEIGSVKGYKFEEIVNKDNHSTFIKGFLARQERVKQAENSKKRK